MEGLKQRPPKWIEDVFNTHCTGRFLKLLGKCGSRIQVQKVFTNMRTTPVPWYGFKADENDCDEKSTISSTSSCLSLILTNLPACGFCCSVSCILDWQVQERVGYVQVIYSTNCDEEPYLTVCHFINLPAGAFEHYYQAKHSNHCVARCQFVD